MSVGDIYAMCITLIFFVSYPQFVDKYVDKYVDIITGIVEISIFNNFNQSSTELYNCQIIIPDCKIPICKNKPIMSL